MISLGLIPSLLKNKASVRRDYQRRGSSSLMTQQPLDIRIRTRKLGVQL